MGYPVSGPCWNAKSQAVGANIGIKTHQFCEPKSWCRCSVRDIVQGAMKLDEYLLPFQRDKLPLACGTLEFILGQATCGTTSKITIGREENSGMFITSRVGMLKCGPGCIDPPGSKFGKMPLISPRVMAGRSTFTTPVKLPSKISLTRVKKQQRFGLL